MSDQADAVNRLMRERGVLPPEDPGKAPENGGAPIADLLNSVLPKVILPGEGVLLSKFAREIGRVVADKFMYRRAAAPLIVNQRTQSLDLVDSDSFRSLVEQKLICIKQKVHRETTFTIANTMPVETARGTLRAPEFLDALPEIARVNTVRLPVLRAPTAEEKAAGKPGRIDLLPEGYDAESRTYTFPSGIVYDEKMTADHAVGFLTSLTNEFPFGDWSSIEEAAAGPVKPSRSQAVVIAGMLTMFGAGLLHERSRKPAFIYSSNSVGSGKTLLGQLAVIPVRGNAPVTPWPSREEELKKLLDSSVLNGDLFLLFDNLRGLIKSPSLEAFITGSDWTGRLLGGNGKFTSPNYVTVFLTGNQATVNEDMDRRSLFVELFVEETDIQKRKIKREIDEVWLGRDENRSMILSAMWALVKEWDAAGRPKNTRRFASFTEWTETIAGIVQHAGLGDCVERVQMTAGGNKEMDDMRKLVIELSRIKLVGGEDYEFSTVVSTAVEHGLFDWIVDDVDLQPKQKSSLGKLLTRFEGRTFVYDDGVTYRFGKRGKHRTRRYSVARVES